MKKIRDYTVLENYGLEPAVDEKGLLDGLDSILKQTTSRDTAAWNAAKYLEETPEVSKQWMQKKGIVSFDDFKKWCANRQSKVRSGVREKRKQEDLEWKQWKAQQWVENVAIPQALQASREYDEYLNSVHDSKNQNTMRSTKFKSKRIQDAVNRFLNKDLKNRQSFMRVVDSEGRINERVVFLKEDDDSVLAVFPDTFGNADRNKDTMVCYAQVGQHSVCTYDYAETLTPATEEEYQGLYDELTNKVGYNLTVINSLPLQSELLRVRDNFIKAYNIERRRKLADSMQQIDDARVLERGEEIEYKGKRGKVQYALFHGQEPVVIRWQNEDGSEEFEVPYNEVGDLKVKDSVNEKPQADNKVMDDDESADENVDENVDENTDIEEGDEVADGCGKKKTKDSKVNIFKRKTTKKQ